MKDTTYTFLMKETKLQKHQLCSVYLCNIWRTFTIAIRQKANLQLSTVSISCVGNFGQITHSIGCKRTKLTKSFEHIFVRRRSKARKSLYFSACDSLRRLEESESITYKLDIRVRPWRKLLGILLLQTASNILNSFFLEHAGELCIIILRRKKGFKTRKTNWTPTPIHTLTKSLHAPIEPETSWPRPRAKASIWLKGSEVRQTPRPSQAKAALRSEH